MTRRIALPLAAAAALSAVFAPALAGGAAGGANASDERGLERCAEAMGTVAVAENQGATWYQYLSSLKLGSTVPVLRMMIQQSNCFVIVERGAAMANMKMERDLMASGEMRGGSNFGKGQMVAADYTISPSITFSQNTGGVGGGVGGFGGGVAAGVGGSRRTHETSTTLIMIDNRSGVQLAAAEGSASHVDWNLFGGLFAGGVGVGAGGYARTPEGKTIIAAFADSYNQLVRATRNYRAQTVRGGLGTGGALGVQGGRTGKP